LISALLDPSAGALDSFTGSDVQQDPAADRRAASARLPWRQALLHGNGLARRVLVLVVLFSSAITAAITALELYGEYRRDLRTIDDAFQFVASRYLPSLVNSVWNVDEVQVQSQLDALVGLPHVEYIAVEENGRVRWAAGRVVSQRTKEQRLALRHGDAAAPIGQLHIVASVDRVLGRLWAHLVEMLVGNALKTLLVAAFLLVCFQMLITQHLSKAGRHLSHVDLDDPAPPRPLVLDRPRGGPWRPDILDAVVDAINTLLRSQHALRERLVRSQADLADSEARLRLGLEATGAALWDWDIRGARLYVDDDGVRALGREASTSAAGARRDDYAFWEAQLHPDDLKRARATLREHFGDSRADARFILEVRMRTDEGGWRWAAWRGRVVERDEHGAPRRATGTLVDIDQRKRAEAQVLEMNRLLEDRVRERTLALEHARDDAERASRAKSEFLSRMSHELRTPMNAILGFAQLIELSGVNPKLQRWGREIRAAGGHLLKLIEDLLDLSQIEVGHISVRAEPLALAPLLDEAIEIVQGAQPQQPAQIERHLAPALPPLLADIVRLKQILVNLLTNAAKYTPGGGRIVVGAETRPDGRVRIAVRDEGIGIARDQLERLFQPFERLGREGTGIEGTGVGLALSKRLADLMGCELGVESVEGTGSTFWLDVPTAPQNAGVAARSAPPAPTAGTREMRVLYIEDNAINRAVMQAFFDSQPAWRLLLAEDGQSGLRMAREALPDTILLDLHLPDCNGHDVLLALRADPATAGIRVIALSADARPEERERGLRAGLAAYLTKPVVFAELIAALEKSAE
jgi:signal transduction histidine kinase